jgi:hypothetical protein
MDKERSKRLTIGPIGGNAEERRKAAVEKFIADSLKEALEG